MDRAVTLTYETRRRWQLREAAFLYFRRTRIQVYRIIEDKSGVRLTEVFSSPAGSAIPETVLKKLSTYNIQSLDLILPRELFVSKRLALPASDFREARKMALLKLPKLSPFPAEDSVAEVTDSGRGDKGYLNVSLWIISRKNLFRTLYALGRAGISVNHVRMDMDGIPLLFEKNRLKDAPCMALLLDRSTVHMAIFRDSCLLNSRMFSLPSAPEKEDESGAAVDFEAARGRIVEEADKFIKYVRGEFPQETPAAVFFFQEQCPFLSRESSVDGIPLEPLSFQNAGIIMTPQMKEFPVNVVSCMAARDAMNFLPDSYLELHSRIGRLKKAIKAVSLIVIFLLAFSVVFAVRVGKKTHQVSRLKDQLELMEKETRSIKFFNSRVTVANRAWQSHLVCLDVLKAVTPWLNQRSMTLSSFTFEKGPGDSAEGSSYPVEIAGRADSLSTILGFIENLQADPRFDNVREKSSTAYQKNSTEYTFTISFNYTVPKEQQGL
jgi:hypothetical protein